MFRIATWNVNSLRIRLPQVLQWLETEQLDVLALQETKMVDEDFPLEEINMAGYQAIYSGQKTYNGVAILSKAGPVAPIVTDFPDFADPQRRVLGTRINDISILNLYVPNGSEVGSEKFDYKLNWLTHLKSYTRSLLKENKNVILLGDFNIAPDERDVHDPDEWEGKVLFSKQEREQLQQLLNEGLLDSFRLFDQEEGSFSWWDYRAAAFRRNRGLRIDHILISKPLEPKCLGCRIDKSLRQLERPSDHTPVIAEFDV